MLSESVEAADKSILSGVFVGTGLGFCDQTDTSSRVRQDTSRACFACQTPVECALQCQTDTSRTWFAGSDTSRMWFIGSDRWVECGLQVQTDTGRMWLIG